MFWAQVILAPLDPPLLLAIKHKFKTLCFVKGGPNQKFYTFLLTSKIKWIIWMMSKTCGGGGKQMFVEFLVMECKGEALEF